MIFGGFDIYNGYNAVENGETGFGRFLLVSGIARVIGSLLIYLINPFGWLFLLVGIILSLTAYFVRDNEIQLWIKKCILSIDPKIKNKYEDYQEQTKFLGALLK